MPITQLPVIDMEKEIKIAAKVFRAIDHPLRKQILQILEVKSKATVTEIYSQLNIDQPVASQHLRILREAKAVEIEKRGREVFYKPNYDKLARLEKIISEIVTEIVSD